MKPGDLVPLRYDEAAIQAFVEAARAAPKGTKLSVGGGVREDDHTALYVVAQVGEVSCCMPIGRAVTLAGVLVVACALAPQAPHASTYLSLAEMLTNAVAALRAFAGLESAEQHRPGGAPLH